MKTRNIKIFVKDKETSRKVQEKLFELDKGISWADNKQRTVRHTDSNFLYSYKKGNLTHHDDIIWFVNNNLELVAAEEILSWEVEPKFKVRDEVLVRHYDDQEWRYDIFSHITGIQKIYKYVCIGNRYSQCIPLKGNEHLLGTTDAPNLS